MIEMWPANFKGIQCTFESVTSGWFSGLPVATLDTLEDENF
jgi:hypothetical protein